MDEHSQKIWTYDDLPDDGQRYEIIDGELFVSPAPAKPHQHALKRLFLAFVALEHAKLATVWFAPFDVKLSPTRVVEPDLFVIRWGRTSAFGPRVVEEAPDLIVEVLSPSTAKHDRTRKRRFYAQSRVREYWLVDPETESIEVLYLDNDALSYRTAAWAGPGEHVKSVTFDLEIDVDAIFRADD